MENKKLLDLIISLVSSKNEKHGAIGNYSIVRTYASGVHIGFIEDVQSNQGRSRITIKDSRRIWYWYGAFTLSKIAKEGVRHPEKQKFSCIVPIQYIEDVIEIIPLTSDVKNNLYSVPTHVGEYER